MALSAEFIPSAVENLYSGKPSDYFAQARTEIAPILPVQATRVLEVGCGTGATVRWLRSQRNVQYAVGIEIDDKAAAQARDLAIFDVVLIGNVESLDIPAEKFDLIIILDVLEHLLDPWRMIHRLVAALAPGGSIIASIPNVGHYSICCSLLNGRWDYANDGLLDKTHLRFFTKRTAIALMSENGLSVRQVERTFKHRIWPWWNSKALNWYSLKLLRHIVPDHFMAF